MAKQSVVERRVPAASTNVTSVLLSEKLSPLFWQPQLLDNASAWFGQIPFAHWVVKETTPNMLVELGMQESHMLPFVQR